MRIRSGKKNTFICIGLRRFYEAGTQKKDGSADRDYGPVCAMLLLAIPLVALGIGMVVVLKERIREIKSGEEDDLEKY